MYRQYVTSEQLLYRLIVRYFFASLDQKSVRSTGNTLSFQWVFFFWKTIKTQIFCFRQLTPFFWIVVVSLIIQWMREYWDDDWKENDELKRIFEEFLMAIQVVKMLFKTIFFDWIWQFFSDNWRVTPSCLKAFLWKWKDEKCPFVQISLSLLWRRVTKGIYFVFWEWPCYSSHCCISFRSHFHSLRFFHVPNAKRLCVVSVSTKCDCVTFVECVHCVR